MKYKELWKGDWVSVISPVDTPYETLHEGNTVFILPIKDNRVGIRFEFCPPYMIKDPSGDFVNYYTVISGSVEEGESYKETAIRELKEEAGIIYKDPEFYLIYENLPVCKSTDLRASCYVVKGEEYEEVEPEGDGTESEKKSQTLWVSIEDFFNILKEQTNIDVLLFNAFFYVLPFMSKSVEEKDTILSSLKITSLRNGYYQLNSNDIPIDKEQVTHIVNSLVNKEKSTELLKSLEKTGTVDLSFSNIKVSNKERIIDLYEVEYSAPADSMKTTQDLANHLDEKHDFVTQYLFPDTDSEDTVISIKDEARELKDKVKVGGLTPNFTWRELLS